MKNRKTYSREEFLKFAETATYKATTKISGKAENLKLNILINGVSEQVAALIDESINTPDEHRYIKESADFDTIEFALASMKGLSYIIGSTEHDQHQVEELERERQLKIDNAELTAYMNTEEFHISELLKRIQPERKAELQVMSYLIARSIKGDSVLKVGRDI